MGGFGDAHRRFWRQCVLWLAKKDEQTEGRVWIRLAGRRAMRGTRVDFASAPKTRKASRSTRRSSTSRCKRRMAARVDVRPTKTGDGLGGHVPRNRRSRATIASRSRRKTATQELGHGRSAVPGARSRFGARPPGGGAEPHGPTGRDDQAGRRRGAGRRRIARPLKRLADKPPELKEEVVAKVTYWDTWPFFLLFVGLLGHANGFCGSGGDWCSRTSVPRACQYHCDGIRSMPATFCRHPRPMAIGRHLNGFACEAEPGDEVAHFVERERGAERFGEEFALVGVSRRRRRSSTRSLQAALRRRVGPGRGGTTGRRGAVTRIASAITLARLGDVVDDAVADDDGKRRRFERQVLWRRPGPARCGRRSRPRRCSGAPARACFPRRRRR